MSKDIDETHKKYLLKSQPSMSGKSKKAGTAVASLVVSQMNSDTDDDYVHSTIDP